jgi:putative membrane protein
MKNRMPEWSDVAGGIIGGLLGAYVMGKTMRAVEDLSPRKPEETPAAEQPTVKTAAAISEMLLHKTLTQRQREPAGRTVHYMFGALLGGLYGLLAPESRAVRAGAGTLYGLAVWFGADELALPALKLTPPARELPKSMHVEAAAAHVVFGITLDSVWRASRPLLRAR